MRKRIRVVEADSRLETFATLLSLPIAATVANKPKARGNILVKTARPHWSAKSTNALKTSSVGRPGLAATIAPPLQEITAPATHIVRRPTVSVASSSQKLQQLTRSHISICCEAEPSL